jgi:hypothetical protein
LGTSTIADELIQLSRGNADASGTQLDRPYFAFFDSPLYGFDTDLQQRGSVLFGY